MERQTAVRRNHNGDWLAACSAAVSLVAGIACAGPPAGDGSYTDLLAVFAELQQIKQPQATRGLPDFGPEAIGARRRQIADLQARMQHMGVARWSVSEQVDYLTVRAELDQQQFILDVTRPWARDPLFYIAGLLEIAFTELPVAGEDLAILQSQLRAIPDALAAARDNLADVAVDYADLAIRSLVMSDGVENGYPYRETPPAGVIGWYEDLLGRAGAQPGLRADIEPALDALRRFHAWLIDGRATMNGQNGVGKAALDWFVQYGLLLPYTSEQMVELTQREFDRLWGFYALERHRNRALPEIELSRSRDEYHERLGATDELVRTFLADEGFISIPDFVPTDWQEMGYNVPWIVRATPPNYWEQVQFRDPFPDHVHAVIPGHRFDALMAASNSHPIRGKVNFGARWQGWAVYLEEATLQAGALESRPRTRELIYLFGIWRAARTLGDIYNQWNEMTADETSEYWLSVTPLLDPDVARKYAYLRPAPGHGLEYTIGNFEMWRLLADRKRQLGDNFVLGEFHDEFMAKGRIPISLIRYEMTGFRDDVARFWDRPPLESVIGR
ncbi:MAG: DUF885 domain-containing protein [Gammaproteobacteria bacterium]|nr:DUF885 domain-containing protein [Gammaproteobacteria bacterium]MDH4255363.1 DUF885 domain-containing protein [Gammaproteobacteria bacterium]MDH5311511.1 DUF885 domain-containing protein [Gammaproteobacteria bacterium]